MHAGLAYMIQSQPAGMLAIQVCQPRCTLEKDRENQALLYMNVFAVRKRSLPASLTTSPALALLV